MYYFGVPHLEKYKEERFAEPSSCSCDIKIKVYLKTNII